MGYLGYLTVAPIVSMLMIAALAALRKYRSEPPARSLSRYIALSLALLVLNAWELLAPTEFLKILSAKLEYVTFLLLPISFFSFCMRYTGHERYISKKVRLILIGISVCLFAIVATNELHGLFYIDVRFPVIAGFKTMRPVYGPFFWVIAIYSWGLVIVGVYVVFRSYIVEEGPYRTRSLAIVAGTLLPGVFNLIYIFKLLPFLMKDFTPIGYALGGLLFFIGAYLTRAARVIPLARGIVLQELDEGVVFIDPAGRLADYNASAQGLLGLTDGDLGRPVTALAALDPVASVFAAASCSSEGLSSEQTMIRGRSVVVRARRLDSGAVSRGHGDRGVAMTLTDVSERVRMQDELDAVRNDMLKREHFAVIGRLSADIAHEINNPLGYVWAEFRSIKATAAGAIGDDRVRSEVFEMIEAAEDGLSRIDKVVHSLLEYARRGSGEESPAPYDLARGVQSALELSRSDYARVAVIDVDLEETPHILARGSEIDRVLINILRNATEAVRSRVSKTGERGRIWIKTRLDGARVICEIGNNGIPIDDDASTRVFEEFFSTKTNGTGTGLGLSISKDIVEKRHGGRLMLISNDPVVFRMELPVAEFVAP